MKKLLTIALLAVTLLATNTKLCAKVIMTIDEYEKCRKFEERVKGLFKNQTGDPINDDPQNDQNKQSSNLYTDPIHDPDGSHIYWW